MINEEIKKILREFNISEKDGMPYLLSLHFGYNPDYFPDYLRSKINLTKIVESSNSGLEWNVPLFSDTVSKFDWVKDRYIELFKKVGKGTNVRESTARMKRLFAENPEVRIDDVIGATEMYLTATNPKFVRMPHYFIQKGTGGAKTEDILDWIDRYKEITNDGQDRSRVLR